MTKIRYLELIYQAEEAENTGKKTPLQQRRLKRFDVPNIKEVKKPIIRSNIKYYLPVDKLYDLIDAAHVAVSHEGQNRILAETSKKYANITKEMIVLY